MAVLTSILLIATFQLAIAAAAQQESTRTIPPIVLNGSNKEACPSKDEVENVLLEIRRNTMAIVENYRTIPECGGGLWYRVAYLNMSDPLQQCPTAWSLYNVSGVRACSRPATSGASCPGTFYPTGRQYSKVCGRVTGYQVASPGAFFIIFLNTSPSSLDDIYVDGVSVTHGSPRTHIWTFAAGVTEGTYSGGPGPDCPCSRQGATPAPSYIGNDYYCESGNSVDGGRVDSFLYGNDPLWDGKQCEGQCCSDGKSPPWFSVELTDPTTDDIEVRICADESTDNEDTPLSLVELYVI